MRRRVLILVLISLVSLSCFAHRPYEEREDITAGNPWMIKRADISTAIYATMESDVDIDYYTFRLDEGDPLYLSMVIPKIAGQEGFAPTMVLLGPDYSIEEFYSPVDEIDGVFYEPAVTFSREFFEPFTRTDYWIWQEIDTTVEQSGEYAVVVFDRQKRVGRYVFTVGKKEIPGGDMMFLFFRFKDYWMAVTSGEKR